MCDFSTSLVKLSFSSESEDSVGTGCGAIQDGWGLGGVGEWVWGMGWGWGRFTYILNQMGACYDSIGTFTLSFSCTGAV